jgi:HPt (histidine-containing phosphotransfer) domain-containing protein
MTDSAHRVNVVKGKDEIDYEEFEPTTDLPVVDEVNTLEQCGDWAFVVELLGDFINERDSNLEKLNLLLKEKDHTEFHKVAHALKGASLNLHLPALVDVSKKLEKIGKQLEITSDDERLLNQRQPLVDALTVEYDRLEKFLPRAKELASAEAESDAQ